MHFSAPMAEPVLSAMSLLAPLLKSLGYKVQTCVSSLGLVWHGQPTRLCLFSRLELQRAFCCPSDWFYSVPSSQPAASCSPPAATGSQGWEISLQVLASFFPPATLGCTIGSGSQMSSEIVWTQARFLFPGHLGVTQYKGVDGIFCLPQSKYFYYLSYHIGVTLQRSYI